MTIKITLTTAEADTGPFDLYSNVDAFMSSFDVDITQGQLLAGYTTSDAPDGTTIVRVQSKGNCTSYVDIPLVLISYQFTLFSGIDCPAACSAAASRIFM